MILTIPDSLYAQYLQASRAAGVTASAEALIVRQLERFAGTPPTQRVLVLGPEILQTLDQLLGVGAGKDPQTFLTRLQEYASLTIGNIRVDFTPAQKAEIEHRAARQGKTPREVTEAIVRQLSEQFFWEGTPTR